MKKFLLAVVALTTIVVSASAMSYEQACRQALFLTDKMAYELNLTDEQYEAAYEVNLDYLMSISNYDELYGRATYFSIGSIVHISMRHTSIVPFTGATDSGTSQSMPAIHIATTSTLVVLISIMYTAAVTLGITMADAPGTMAVTSAVTKEASTSGCATVLIAATSGAGIADWSPVVVRAA